MGREPTVKEALDKSRRVLTRTLKIMAKEEGLPLCEVIEALRYVERSYIQALMTEDEKAGNEKCRCEYPEPIQDYQESSQRSNETTIYRKEV